MGNTEYTTAPVPLDLETLNPEQRRAVEHPGGPLLVLAGAGSGKTRVVTCRIARLILHDHVPPWRILAVTFTNKAADEMRQRVAALVGPSAEKVWLSTFHALCARLLRREAEAMGRQRDFLILDQQDAEAVVRRAAKAREWPTEGEFRPARILHIISLWKREMIDPQDATSRAHSSLEQRAAVLYGDYQRQLVAANAFDFDDLLTETVRLFRERPEVLSRYQEQFLHVLVDEYQDTSALQHELTRMLAARHRNLCVVGDDDQSIYRWRGATVEHILDFDRHYPDVTIIKLEQNYRSTRTILEAANGVVRCNKGRRTKRLWTAAEGGARIKLISAADEETEAEAVVRSVQQECTRRQAGEVAIFYRTNAQSRNFEEALIRAGLPYVVVGGLRFYERREVKDLLAYLRLVCNPRDDVSCQRIVNVPRRKIGTATIERIDAAARSAGTSWIEAALTLLRAAALPAAAAGSVTAFVQLVDELRRDAPALTASALLRRIVERTDYLTWLAEEDSRLAESRAENVDELINALERFEATRFPGGTAKAPEVLPRFLENVALIADIDAVEQSPDVVTLMTLHTAKGLEFPVVFLTGLEEGTLPHALSLEDARALEEERRLCYVGITRAREQLYLSHAYSRRTFGTTRRMTPSRFLNEVPAELVERVGGFASPLFDEPHRETPPPISAYPSTSPSAPSGSARADSFRPGDRVRHRTFGLGSVVHVQGSGPAMKITVDFHLAGTKTLVQRIAKLVRV